MKKMRLKLFLTSFFLIILASPVLAVSGEIHVLLGTTSNGVISGTSMTALAKDKSVSLSGSYHVRLSGGKLRVGSQNLTMPVTLSASQPIKWNGKLYYGQITFSPASAGFSVGNRLDMEMYLCGVLSAEMHPAWHIEALKSQAVIARSYATRNKGSHGAFDLCATTHCQEYRGVTDNERTLSAAVVATKGLVLRHGGNLAATFYHSDSGGMVTRAGAVWNSDYPYLQPRAEPVLYTSPNTTWEISFPMSQVQSMLAAGGVSVGTVQSLTPTKRDESGRVEQLEVRGSSGTMVISGNKFRTIMGSTVVKSTLFEFGARSPYNPAVADVPNMQPNTASTLPRPAAVPTMTVPAGVSLSQMPNDKNEQIVWMTQNRIFTTQELMEILSKPDMRDQYIEIGVARIKGEKEIPVVGSALVHPVMPQSAVGTAAVTYAKPNLSMTPATGSTISLYGRGYGHGVGLSQWGAKAMAEAGWTFDRILMHYFPGTILAQ